MATKDSKYNRSPKGVSRYARYRDTEKGRANERVQQGRRTFRSRQEQLAQLEKELGHS